MATPPGILATILANIQTATSSFRSALMTIRPLYTATSAVTMARGAVPAPAGITSGLFGLGILGYIPATVGNLQALARLQSFATPGMKAPKGFTMPF